MDKKRTMEQGEKEGLEEQEEQDEKKKLVFGKGCSFYKFSGYSDRDITRPGLYIDVYTQ